MELPFIHNSIVETIGNTPIVRLNRVFSHYTGAYFGKMETFNPGRSSKDRIGVSIIEDAENKGLIKPGGTIVEATSGNTGLGLALVGIERGYKVILVMPDKMSAEKINLVKAIGCEVIVTPTDVEPDDPRSYYSVSKKIAENTDNSFYANQYYNQANPKAHYETTGPEIWKQTGGKITHFFAGVGTGGTISGVGKYLKEQNSKVKIIGIDPEGSILAHYHKYKDENIEAHSYKVEGVGEDIIPGTVYFDVIDDFVKVSDQESFDWTRKLAKEEGLMVGGSSGLAAAGAAKYAQLHPNEDMFAVILFPDTGERYLGRVFSESWLRANGFLPAPKDISEILNAKPANIPPIISIPSKSTLITAMECIRKFKINQVIISEDNKLGKLLDKNTIYNALLKGADKQTLVEELELTEIHTLDYTASMTELISTLLTYGLVIITKSDEWIGVITKQDVVDNIPIERISLGDM